MAILKVQDDAFNFGGTPASNSSTVTAHYTSNTVSGNLLICVVGGFVSNSTSPVPVPTIHTPTTSGMTWVLAGSLIADEASGTGFYRRFVAIYYALNAPSISSGTNTSCNVTTAIAPDDIIAVEPSLYEFSGLVSSPLDQVVTAKGNTTVPSAGSLIATQIDLLFVAGADGNTGIELVAGPGFTLSSSSASAATGDSITEYKLNASPGTYTATFAAGSFPVTDSWSCVAVAFSPVNLGGGGTNGTGTPSGVTAASAQHSLIPFVTIVIGAPTDVCPGPPVLELIPGFSDVPSSVLEAEDPAFALHLGEIAFNATFGMVRCEIFVSPYKHNETVRLPISCFDGYHYSREELNYLWAVKSSADPSTDWITGPDSLWFANWNVDQATGLVNSEEWYERSSDADTRIPAKSNDGTLLVFTIAQRDKATMIMNAVASYASINESTIGTDKPITQDLIQHLNNNAKFSCVNSEVIYLGEYINGQTVVLPVSPVDGYHYSSAECKFMHAWRWTANGTKYAQTPGNYEQAGPFTASINGSGVVSIAVTFATNGGEDMVSAPGFGRIAAFAFCTRSATPASGTLANNFTELDLGFFAPGRSVRASELLVIKRNIDEAVLSPEFFGPTEHFDGDTVSLPVSPVDGYVYTAAETQFIWSWSATTNGTGSHLRLPIFFGGIDPLTGTVKLRCYRLPPGGPYTDDNNTLCTIKILTVATRQAVHPEIPSGPDDSVVPTGGLFGS